MAALVDPVSCEFLAGGLGGAVGVFIGQPFDFIKVRLQALGKAYAGPLDCLSQTLRREGVGGLYRGILPPVINSFVLNAILFTTYDHGHGLVCSLQAHGAVHSFLAGSYAGLLSVGALVPFDLVKCQMQVDRAPGASGRYRNSLHCARSIMREGGVATLYRGTLITALRDSPATGAYFVVFEELERRLPLWVPALKGDRSVLIAGGTAGVLTWAAAYPFDTVKTYIMSQPVDAPAHRRQVLPVARALLRENGVRWFYRGLGTCLIRAFPVNAATFLVYKRAKELLCPCPDGGCELSAPACAESW